MPSARSAEGKARQRERNPDIGKGLTFNSRLRTMPKRAWEDVEEQVEHVADFEAHISQFQVTPHVASLTMQIPINYAQDIVLLQQQGVPVMFFRTYLPPLPPHLTGETSALDLTDASED